MLDVHRRVVEYGGDVIEQVAALLHDVVEDTDHTLDELAAKGVPPAALEIVRLLTRAPGEPRGPYYARIREHEPARRVKLLADVASNSDPGRMALLPPEERAKKSVKYAQARVALGG